ncbi:uncharacterized protein M421DRAFT_422795 [Didymella exigua CBS 183.55]|uniref:RING-type domain-containing protein n=1 Tax=Didymella exigua CBS 183.55 TaxID=1150837 RepID=A0A6A5RJ65_9PLEO|nr:uncharacterized protein M421DRAFT_422795 [Didymella exigua CBS 183.55]KAF1926466.1 hypothetical protein M421DRAFT_422795 [Didymella exigua CBS 183.55]
MRQISEQASYTRGTVLTPVKADTLDRNERACYICFQPFGSTASLQAGPEGPVQLPCGHVFGEVCISIWIRSSNSCPFCRKKVLDIDGWPASRHVPESSSSNTFSSEYTTQDDVWLDEEVWNNSSDSLEDAVSYADIEALIEHYTRDLSNVNFDSQPQRRQEALVYGEHHGLCHCIGGRGIRNAALPLRRLTSPATVEARPMDIDNFDLAQMGSQFAEVNY